jgi:hypothetical protein
MNLPIRNLSSDEVISSYSELEIRIRLMENETEINSLLQDRLKMIRTTLVHTT